MAIGMDMMSVPWLEKLLAMTTFFTACEVHFNKTKNECNKFCLDCNDRALCGSCIKSGHKDHRVIQIRRSSYNEAVKTTDIYKHVDILGIQTYVINSSTVVFLNKRARTQPKRNNRVGKCYSSDSLCRICERNLVDTSFFCSLACKLAWIKENDGFFVSAKEREELEKLLEESIKVSPAKEKAKLVEQNRKRKLEGDEEDQERENEEVSEENEEDEEKDEEESVLSSIRPPGSLRKPNSRRKGIPHRAPFF